MDPYEEKKLEYFQKSSQSVLFDSRGIVIDTCDTLVPMKSLNIYHLEFFAGLEESLKALSSNQELTFEGIHTDLFGHDSYYDFVIRKRIINGICTYSWLIYDFGRQYRRAFEMARNQVNGGVYSDGSIVGNKMLFKTTDRLVNLDLNEVLYFEAYGDYVKIHTKEKTHVHYNRMKHIEAQVPEGQFFRVHRSFIVSLDKIENIEKEGLQIRDRWIPISASNKALLINRLNHVHTHVR